MDEIEKKQTFNNGFERTKFKHMAGWESFLNDTLKIPFNWFICKETKKLKSRDLTGPEKMKLFRNIDFTQILPNHSKSADILQLWTQFMSITDMLSSSNLNQSIEQFQQKSKAFMDQFLQLYHTKHVTPYMHALLWHVPEFLKLYGQICSFTQQGFEKLNDKTTKDFFRSTNQRGLDALTQIVQKRNRMEHLEDLGCQTKTRTFNCSNCAAQGHNILTCMSECNTCGFKPCCSPSHVMKSNGKWDKQCENVQV